MLYAPLGFTAFHCARRLKPRAAIALAGAAGFLLSASVECLQLYIPTRNCSGFDLSANTLGALAGALAAWLAAQYLPAPNPGSRPAAFLLVLWAAAQTCPWVIQVHLDLLAARVRGMAAAPASWPEAALALCEGVALGLAARAFTRFATPLLSAALALAPLARLVLISRPPSAWECAAWAAGLALAGWISPRLAAGCLAIAIVAAGLFPTLARPWPLNGRRFPRFPEGASNPAVAFYFAKAFRYAALLWLLRRSGAGWRLSATATVIALAAVEAAQLSIPGHVPETTDPLLAATLAFLLRFLERPAAPARPQPA